MMRVTTFLMFLGALLPSSAGLSQDRWPSKTITFIVPYAAGGYTDAVGRITARYVEKTLNQTVVVENRSGAGGIVGTDYVAKSKPDGYTFCVCSGGAVSVAPIAQKVPYKPLTDFTPISIVSTIPEVVIIKPSLPVKTIKELIQYARAHPGELDYASSGAGGMMHFSALLFQARTDTEMTHLPFRGAAPATAAVVSGEADLSFTMMTTALPQMEAKTVRALAVTSAKRSQFIPALPTIDEMAVPGFSIEAWNGIIAPSGTPEPIIERMAQILTNMAEDPQVKKAMTKIGATAVAATPGDFMTAIAQELEQWRILLQEIDKN